MNSNGEPTFHCPDCACVHADTVASAAYVLSLRCADCELAEELVRLERQREFSLAA